MRMDAPEVEHDKWITIRMDSQLWTALKLECIRNKVTMNRLVRTLIRRWLSEQPAPAEAPAEAATREAQPQAEPAQEEHTQ